MGWLVYRFVLLQLLCKKKKTQIINGPSRKDYQLCKLSSEITASTVKAILVFIICLSTFIWTTENYQYQ